MKYTLASVLGRVIPITHGERAAKFPFCWNQRLCVDGCSAVFLFDVNATRCIPKILESVDLD